MNLEQNQNQRMLKATDTYLGEHTSAYTSTPILTTYRTQLHNKIGHIDEVDSARPSLTGGVSDNKTATRSELVSAIYSVTQPVKAYAVDDHPDIFAIVNKTETEIIRMRDNDLVGYGALVVTTLTPKLTDLTDYGITTDKLTLITTKGTAFNSLIGKMGSSEANSMNATESVENLIHEAKEFLDKKVDVVVNGYKDSNYSFYSGYKNARRIIEVGVRHDGSEEENPTPSPSPMPNQ